MSFYRRIIIIMIGLLVLSLSRDFAEARNRGGGRHSYQHKSRGHKYSGKRYRKSYGKSRRGYSAPYCRASTTPPQVPADTSEVARQCSGANNNKSVRTFTCIQWVTQQAEKAYSNEPVCKGRVTSKMLMCIIKQEVGHYTKNPCVKNGCGMTQFTTAGVSYVKSALSSGLSTEYDYFWDLVGRPNQKAVKCSLNRKHGLDRDTAVAMAATHLCKEAKEGIRSTQAMAQRYNGHPRYKYAYGRSVSSCVSRGDANPFSQRARLGVKSECRKFRICGGRKLTSKGKRSHAKKHYYRHRGRSGAQ